MKNFLKKHKKLLIFLVIIAAVVIAAAAGSRKKAREEEKKKNAEMKTEKIETRTIVTSVSGTGSVAPIDEKEIQAEITQTKVQSVKVSEGDRVTAGQVIAVLDSSDLEDSLATLQENHADSLADKADRDNDYNQQITDNQQNREKRRTDYQNRIATAQTKLDSAQQDLVDAKATLENDKAKQAAGDATVTDATIWADRNRVSQYQSSVDTYQDQIDSLNDSLSDLNEEDDSDLIQARDDYDDSMEDTLENQQDQIDRLKEQIDECTVTSDIDGVVTAVYVENGDSYNGQTIAKVENDTAFQIVADIDEADIPDVTTGLAAKIKTDATGDEQMDGTVSFVAPSSGKESSSSGLGDLSSLSGVGMGGLDMSKLTGGSSSSKAATYVVKIALASQNERLRLGMTANVSIIISSADDVLSVPYESVHKEDDGSAYIEVVTKPANKTEDGKAVTKKIPVTTGLEGTYYTEVSSPDIEEGMTVVVPLEKSGTSVDELLNVMGTDGGVR